MRSASHSQRLDPARVRTFRRLLLKWFQKNGRTFFWRTSHPSAYQVLVTEMLLSRTRAENVEPVAKELFARYPTVNELAEAPVEDVEKVLYPLGLYRKRARFLAGCARAIVELHASTVPRRFDELEALPYVGRYAANALLNVAFNVRRPIVDANVARVYQRVFSLSEPPARLENAHELWGVAEVAVPKRRSHRFNWALLDLGASICGKAPSCAACPVVSVCDTGLNATTKSRRRVA